VNAVALHKLDQANSTLKDWLTLCVKPEKLSAKVNSLIGKVGELSEGPFVLPFVPIGDRLKHFIAIPKELISTKITTPSDWGTFTDRQKKEHPMKYAYWSGAERICTVSEPFLTPVIQHVLNTLGGIGVPDYPDQMKDILKKILSDFSASGATAVSAAAAISPSLAAAAPPPAAAPEPPSVSSEPSSPAVGPEAPVAMAESASPSAPTAPTSPSPDAESNPPSEEKI
jgi:hypothetical protein